MNSNVPMLDEFAGNNTKEVIRALNETIQKQQAEIESLKKEAALQRLSDFTQQAEIEALKNRNWNLVSETWGFDRQPTDLTDEEIYYCWSHSYGNTPWMKQKAFARAILRKANEK